MELTLYVVFRFCLAPDEGPERFCAAAAALVVVGQLGPHPVKGLVTRAI
jgi:hypothetical protein